MGNDAVDRRILDCANVEFAKSGYHRTVVSDIAARAGVGKGTVYRRFGDKKRLFTAMIRQRIRDMEAALRAVLDEAAAPEQNLAAIVDVYLGLSDHSRELIEIIITEGTQLINKEKEELKEELEAVLQLIEGVFREGLDQGRFRIRDTRNMAFLLHRFLISVLEGSVLFGFRPRETVGPLLLDVVLNGIRSDQAGGSPLSVRRVNGTLAVHRQCSRKSSDVP
ncbi:MAG: TetR/AcrR family transcriptional regulator [Desulfohalobiaceae bacterium]|nr:TetR/AcrR family transcriptional regulator [Desulfohalobiaceae bacterium]